MQVLTKAVEQNATRHHGYKCGQSMPYSDYMGVITQILQQSNIREIIYLQNDGKIIIHNVFSCKYLLQHIFINVIAKSNAYITDSRHNAL